MSHNGKAIVRRLHPHSPLQDFRGDGFDVIDGTIGEWLDRYEQENGILQLFLLHATGKFLDIHGEQKGVLREPSESDESYRKRILIEKNMHNCIPELRDYGVRFWDYVADLGSDVKTFYLRLFNFNGGFLPYKPVYLNITYLDTGETVTYNETTTEYGFAKFDIPIVSAAYNVEYGFRGDSENHGLTSYINVARQNGFKKQSVITAETFNGIRHNFFNVILTQQNGASLPDKDVTIKVNGLEYYKTTDAEGRVILQINLFEKSYDIEFWFNGDDDYTFSYGRTVINVGQEEYKNRNFMETGNFLDIRSSVLTSENTYLDNEYLGHSNASIQKHLTEKFLFGEVVEWF